MHEPASAHLAQENNSAHPAIPDKNVKINHHTTQYVEPTIDLQIPERAQLAEILCKQPGDLTPVQLPGLRIRAAELMVALYDKRETKKRDAVGRRPPAKIVVKEESLRPDPFPY